jgi:hypothetical protein
MKHLYKALLGCGLVAVVLLGQTIIPGFGTGVGGGSGTQSVQTSVVNFSAAQIIAMSGAGSQPDVVAAPGAGQFLNIISAVIEYSYGTRPFPAGMFSINYPAVGSRITGGDFTAISFEAEDRISFMLATFPTDFFVSGSASSFLNKSAFIRTVSDMGTGSISTATVASGGTGYAPGNTVTVDSAGTATLTITTVGAMGVVTGFTISSVDADYEVSNGVATTTTSGIGTGLTVNVTSIAQGDGTLRVTTYYTVITGA